MLVGDLKEKSGKGLFKNLNEHSKELQSKQEEIVKKHNSLVKKYEELEHLKVNMNDYLGRNKTEKKKSRLLVRLIGIGLNIKRNPKQRKKPPKEVEI